MKTFLWKSFGDIIPSKKALLRRKTVENPSSKPCCNTSTEDVVHAWWSCLQAQGREVWEKSNMRGSLLGRRFADEPDLVWTGLEQNQDEAEFFARLLWLVWLRRNKKMVGAEVGSIEVELVWLKDMIWLMDTWLKALFRRKKVGSLSCEPCKCKTTSIEDAVHALWSCPQPPGREVWQKSNTLDSLLGRHFGDEQELVWIGLEKNQDEAGFFAKLLWLVWLSRRNKTRVGTEVGSIKAELVWLKDGKQGQPQPPVARWTPPETDVFKVNFEGVVFPESQKIGVGIVIRDSEGQIMVALSEKLRGPRIQKPEVVEAFAARRAIIFAREHCRLHQVVLEGDCQMLMQALQTGDSNSVLIGHLVADVRHHTVSFKRCNFTFVSKSCNRVAHALAQYARNVKSFQVWMEDLPPLAIPLALKDALVPLIEF